VQRKRKNNQRRKEEKLNYEVNEGDPIESKAGTIPENVRA